ncbi:hypothetical protein [Helicobacter pylori]|uniref:hypothetical protein n=1 Tax=Helicobacter pylori TaxID=210 RepID=UPI0035A9765D
MRQEHETTARFNQLKAITQAMRALKNGALKNATNQESERTQASANAKATTSAKKWRLNPTKKAFSERTNTAFTDNSQASDEVLKQGLAKHQDNKKEPSDEA